MNFFIVFLKGSPFKENKVLGHIKASAKWGGPGGGDMVE